MDASVARTSDLRSAMSESPLCWGDSIPGFREPLVGALPSDDALIRVFREGEAKAASTGRGGALERHPGRACDTGQLRTRKSVK